MGGCQPGHPKVKHALRETPEKGRNREIPEGTQGVGERNASGSSTWCLQKYYLKIGIFQNLILSRLSKKRI